MIDKSSDQPSIRPLRSPADLCPVADLIETGFSTTLDQDGRDFIAQLRRAGNCSSTSDKEQGSYPLQGFVWEDSGKIVGNLSLIPFNAGFSTYMLIANVSVDPAFRGRGIGKALTRHAIDHCKAKSIKNLWLQVREENDVARHLYQELGFQTVLQRDTWSISQTFDNIKPPSNGWEITKRRRSDWSAQKAWLKAIYPNHIGWNLNFDPARLRPGLFSSIAQIFNGQEQVHWACRQGQETYGFAAFERGLHRHDHMWLAVPDAAEPLALSLLLDHFHEEFELLKPVHINYPAFCGREVFQNQGFKLQHSLIWMSYPI